jgi:DNA-binding MarR family transcriptional regulator
VAIDLAGSELPEVELIDLPLATSETEADQTGVDAGALGDVDAHGLTEVVARLRRALRASIRTDIAWEALPMAQVELMQSLAERSPARITALAERLHLANSTVSGLVGQLIAGGLIDRGTDPEDRRAAVVVLTDAGRATLVKWEVAHERRIRSALANLGVEQRRAIDLAVPALGELAGLLAEGSVSFNSLSTPDVPN